jgi:hypothetical protein
MAVTPLGGGSGDQLPVFEDVEANGEKVPGYFTPSM